MAFASFKCRAVGLGLSVLILASTGCMSNWHPQSVDRGFHSDIEGALRYGPVSGFIQTPAGGKPGTSSGHRPTFKEIDIDDSLNVDASARIVWREHGLYAGGNFIRLDGKTDLDKSLISQDAAFSAGDRVHSDVQLDWYRIGYEYRFLFRNEKGAVISISPGIGAALLNFDYSLKNEDGLSANRAYKIGTPQIGVKAEWIPQGRFSINAGVLSSIPEATDLFILSAQLTGLYQLWGRPERGGAAFLGVGYELIDFKDNQRLPNRVKADMGPMLLFGIRTAF